MELSAATASATISSPAPLADGFSPFLRRPEYVPKPAGRFGFTVLLLTTAALLVRPSDLFPNLEYWPVYQSLIVLCLALSLRAVAGQLFADVRARAITLILITFGTTIIASHLLRGNIYAARVDGFEFFKIIIFYLLVVASVNSIHRLRLFALALCAFTLTLTTLSVLAYEQLLDLPSLESIRQADMSNEGGVVRRLVGTGIFNDPNDLSLMLVVAISCCFCFATSTTSRWLRLGWWLPIGFFGYAFALTYSRGGLFALLGGAGVAIAVRFGAARAFLLACILVPVLLFVAGGRQTQIDIGNPEDTFQSRLDRWSDGLTAFKQSPLIGIGQDQLVETCGQVAHNTYIQNFAELGIVGGACFLGIVGLSIKGVMGIDLRKADPTLIAFRPYIVGAVAGYAIGMLSLSRGYTISTYLVIAFAAAFINLGPRRSPLQLNQRFFRSVALASVATVVATYLIVRVLSVHG